MYADDGAGKSSLASVSLEDLMNVQITSASKKEQKLSRVAAAVYVITRQEIQRSGATTIPELLRMVPGLNVAQVDSNKWAVSARGFNGRFSNDLLVLVDGRSVYSPLWSGIYWDQLDTMLENIERIEVIRGPGASVWGANAVNGVINIITKSAGETQGAEVIAGGGSPGEAYGAARYGAKIGQRGYYRFHLKDYNEGDFTTSDSRHRGDDGWGMLNAGFRTDLNLSKDSNLTVQGDFFHGRWNEGWLAPLLTSPYEEEYGSTSTTGGDAMATYSRRIGETAEIRARAYFDGFDRREGFADESSRSVNFEFQNHFTRGRHEVVWGLGYRRDVENEKSDVFVRWTPESQAFNLINLFVQDEIALVNDKLYFTLGTKFENGTYAGWMAEPTARMLWTPSHVQSFWIAASRAMRTPSRYDHDLSLDLFATPTPMGLTLMTHVLGNPDIEPEELHAFEAGYRMEFDPHVSLDVATFYNFYQREIVFGEQGISMSLTPFPHLVMSVQPQNALTVKTFGAEAVIGWQPLSRSKWNAGYSWLNGQCFSRANTADLSGLNVCSAISRNQFFLQHFFDVTKSVTFDTNVHFTGASTLASAAEPNYLIPQYFNLDARLGWKLKKHVEISLVGQNLLGPHREFLAEAFLPGMLVPRSAHAQIAWSF